MKSLFKIKTREHFLARKKELEEAREIAGRVQKGEQISDYIARYNALKKARNVLEEKFKRNSILLREMLAQKKRNPKREIKWMFEIQQIEEDIRSTENRLSSIEAILKEMIQK